MICLFSPSFTNTLSDFLYFPCWFAVVSYIAYMLLIYKLSKTNILVWQLIVNFVHGVLCLTKIFNFDVVKYINFSLHGLWFQRLAIKNSYLSLSQSPKNSRVSSNSFIILSLTVRLLIDLKFIFICDVMQEFNFNLLHTEIAFSQHH